MKDSLYAGVDLHLVHLSPVIPLCPEPSVLLPSRSFPFVWGFPRLFPSILFSVFRVVSHHSLHSDTPPWPVYLPLSFRTYRKQLRCLRGGWVLLMLFPSMVDPTPVQFSKLHFVSLCLKCFFSFFPLRDEMWFKSILPSVECHPSNQGLKFSSPN